MKKIMLIAFLSIYYSIFALNVEGKVYDENGQPLNECRVLLFQKGKLLKYITSNSRGEFIINVNEGESYTLEIINPAYEIVKQDFHTDEIFINDNSHVEIHLKPLRERMITSVTIDEQISEEDVEDVGTFSSLPEGYKIIEAKPVKYAESVKTGFNVQQKKWTTKPTVNIDEFKESLNIESIDTQASVPNKNDEIATSYFYNGFIYYDSKKSELSNDVKEVLSVFALKLNNEENTILNITAFADADKEAELGKKIAKARLEAVINYLMKLKVDFSKLKVSAKGNLILKNGCYSNVECNEKQHQENRRVELVFNN